MTDQIVPPSAPAGWYPDSSDPRAMRYWDGTRWGDPVLPVATTQPWSGFAISAFILTLLGVLLGGLAGLNIVLTVLGLIFAFIGYASTKMRRGRALSVAAILIGTVGLVLFIFVAVGITH